MTTGKKTIKTLLKSEKDAGDMVSKIENVSFNFFTLFILFSFFDF